MSRYMQHEKMAYTVEEASKLLSISRAQVYRLIDLGEIDAIKIGRSRRITSKQLESFLVAQEQRAGLPQYEIAAVNRPGRRNHTYE